ncbi:CRISPR-associated endonuclease Cas6 [Sediminibacterium sp.]|uniref:CRISPR-associated endonuclease Cas6 n=1 Tax=Sediminibacterium sp. TaxID=1917865 RepID=UPI0027334516|nr:CRISPR-associated endonuclease Cas6 [Sediminibacterium sp.]MDP3566382.1 CRISPR-associated endonuclease Cas6 [Sediminibacterium sp.]
MKIKSSYLVLKTDAPVKESSSRLRGYIGHRFQEYPLLHHHLQESGYLYTYPLIQYKIINNQPCILGIEEGASVVKEISDQIDNLLLGSNVYQVDEKILYQKEIDIKVSENKQYNLLSPWMALNSKNYTNYNKLRSWKDKKLFLNNILIGNILSMCKSLGIIVNRKLYVHSHLDEEKVVFKGVPMIGFTGEFTVNFQIPDFFGLGKGVSVGFGTVKALSNINAD